MIYTLLWFGWIVAFFVVEGFALHRDMPGATLSEHLRRWFRVDTKLGRTAFLVVTVGLAAWLVAHIITGQF